MANPSPTPARQRGRTPDQGIARPVFSPDIPAVLPPVTPDTIAGLAALCSPPSPAQPQPAHSRPADIPARLFSTWEITSYMIPVAQAHFRRVLREGPALPQGQSDGEGGARWFTLPQVQTLRQHYAKKALRAKGRGKSYLPYRPQGLPAPVITLANAAAASGKTTACLHLALAAVLEGYRVLVIDLDPQANLTRHLAAPTAAPIPETGVLPALARHYAEYLQAENRARLTLGQSPLPLDEPLAKALATTLPDLTRPSRWPGLDLLGAGLGLAAADPEMSLWAATLRGWPAHAALRSRLERDGMLTRYDLVFVDTGPGFGALAQVALGAADMVLVPSGASALACAATARFLALYAQCFARIDEARNRTARALGEAQARFEWARLQVVISRYDDTQEAAAAAQLAARLGDSLLPHRMAQTALITARTPAVYDVDYRSHNRDTYARARESFDAVWADLRSLLPGLWQARAAGSGQGDPP